MKKRTHIIIETIELLKQYNRWRRGDDERVKMPDPTELELSIDHVVKIMQAVENLIKQKGRYNTESAYIELVRATEEKQCPITQQ